MVSDASKKKAAQKKAAAAAKRGGKSSAAASSKAAAVASADVQNGSSVDKLVNEVGSLQISDRTCTGVLCSHPLSRDIRVRCALDNFFTSWFFSIFLCRWIINRGYY